MSDKARLILVSGLSGAGKASILRCLEDIGFEAVDNPPLSLLRALTEEDGHARRDMAVGLDARSRGFDPRLLLEALGPLRRSRSHKVELLFATAEPEALQRRFTETRRRHPMAGPSGVLDGIAAETEFLTPLREAADLVVDTSGMALPTLRRRIEDRYRDRSAGLTVTLQSFAFPAGLPREADMVFDARFLRNPHYDPALRPHTGRDAAVSAYIEADPDYDAFLQRMAGLLELVLPRFVREGKKYATVAVGCTGGRHRSVHLVETLARRLATPDWKLSVIHRELSKADQGSPSGGADAAAGRSGVTPEGQT